MGVRGCIVVGVRKWMGRLRPKRNGSRGRRRWYPGNGFIAWGGQECEAVNE